jgi:hypothetical protein
MMRKKILVFFALMALVLMVGTAVYAASPSGGFSIPWWTADSGSCSSRGGSYNLAGSVGQPDASFSSGGSYSLQGGFRSVPGTGGCTSRLNLPISTR